MMKFIKHNLSFILGAVLLLLMYNTPESLKNISKTLVGRVLLVSVLSYFALFCDIACAIIFATIIIILLHGNKEGFREGNQFEKMMKASRQNADSAEKKMGFGNKEGLGKHTDKKHEKEDKEEKEKEEKEGFIGLDNVKHVTNKLQNYLGFSIIDLDRFMKTSSEKNTISATKDLQ